ncbi:MAG TPA: hypothetical protein VGX50_17455 [Longimicrobium sp.]|nr:hypothetical protein [Longimicrobium sp.]
MPGSAALSLPATEVEAAEVRAWADMYAAMPDDYRARFRPELLRVQGVTLTRCRAIPFSHFNGVLDLGVAVPATEGALDAVLAAYAEADIGRFSILHNPHARPPELLHWLRARGLAPRGGWERIARAGGELPPPPPGLDNAELVTRATGAEWADFLVARYGLPTGPWLLGLVDRSGWTHAVLRREGSIVAARSMYASDGWAWLGVEAPVPGLMAPSWDDDHALAYTLVREGVRAGVERFAADIEAPHPERATPAYAQWDALGFTVLYTRTHYVPS